MAPKVAPDPTTEVVKYEHAPTLEGPQALPTRAIALGPSSSGKRVLPQWLLTSPQAYRRNAIAGSYILYKNILMWMCNFYFCFLNGWSAQYRPKRLRAWLEAGHMPWYDDRQFISTFCKATLDTCLDTNWRS